MRQAWAVVAGAGVAVLGALILGEYEFGGLTSVVTGVLFGLAVAEAVVWVGRDGRPGLVAAAAGLAAAGLLWAGWISVHHRDEGIPAGAWVAAALGAVTAGVRVRSARSAESGIPPEP